MRVELESPDRPINLLNQCRSHDLDALDLRLQHFAPSGAGSAARAAAPSSAHVMPRNRLT